MITLDSSRSTQLGIRASVIQLGSIPLANSRSQQCHSSSLHYLFNKTRALDEMNCVFSVLFVRDLEFSLSLYRSKPCLLCLLHWQADSSPPAPPRKPYLSKQAFITGALGLCIRLLCVQCPGCGGLLRTIFSNYYGLLEFKPHYLPRRSG